MAHNRTFCYEAYAEKILPCFSFKSKPTSPQLQTTTSSLSLSCSSVLELEDHSTSFVRVDSSLQWCHSWSPELRVTTMKTMKTMRMGLRVHILKAVILVDHLGNLQSFGSLLIQNPSQTQPLRLLHPLSDIILESTCFLPEATPPTYHKRFGW
ncbi:hypothetical protein NE237_004622 [Protea cynaroides]|uniref:Uncharacterized protein n=1 Tax=Protea cynaroides TaxID=273540 RepID=A0A9Q0KIY5_9MAGN|nr:hypothetical protein NE237_004622 [Protea cynaroides]